MDIGRIQWLGGVHHRHGDEWVEMEERTLHHRPEDPERAWGSGRIYYCARCDEEVRVQPPPDEGR